MVVNNYHSAPSQRDRRYLPPAMSMNAAARRAVAAPIPRPPPVTISTLLNGLLPAGGFAAAFELL